MKTETLLGSSGAYILIAATVLYLSACKSEPTNTATSSAIPETKPMTSFSQEITSPVHDFQVKAGGVYALEINVKNTGTEPWLPGAAALCVDASYRWHDSNGSTLPIEGNRAALDGALKPGEAKSLKLQVGAPSSPGSYDLWVSMVQEGVSWFFDKGAKPLILHVTVN